MTIDNHDQRRLSVRKIALIYGIPAGAVVRAVDAGELPAVRLTTPTGKERLYVLRDDANSWIESLFTNHAQESITQ